MSEFDDIGDFFFFLQDNSAGINFSSSFLCSFLLSVQITFTTERGYVQPSESIHFTYFHGHKIVVMVLRFANDVFHTEKIL